MLARPPPAVNLGKLGRRACPAVFLHNSPCTPGAARVAILQADGAVVCVTDRRTLRSVLSEEGKWLFPEVTGAAHEGDDEGDGGGLGGAAAPDDEGANAGVPQEPAAVMPGDDVPWGRLAPQARAPLDAAQVDADGFLPEDYVPF